MDQQHTPVTQAEIEALTQDDMEFWLANKFVDPADLVKKVEWWATAVVNDRVAKALSGVAR